MHIGNILLPVEVQFMIFFCSN